VHARVRRHRLRHRRVAEHDELVDAAASARTIGTVAASTGSPGSSFCVAKISVRI
jgi:hypothetical protein